MKRYITLLISALLLFASCTPGKVEFTPDTGTVLRNPLNGWVMYLRRDWDETFWEKSGYDAIPTSEGTTVRVSDYANTAYVRTSWVSFEPEEGKYAWEDPESRLNRLFRSILDRAGYAGLGTDASVLRLMHRLRESDSFPHEVGLFLSYPPEDVLGFIVNKAKNYKFIGTWKVYGDENAARRTFEQYRKCTDSYRRQHSAGIPVERLAVPVT